IRRVANSAISAMTASSASDERSPSMRASAFSLTIASAVLGGAPALPRWGRRAFFGKKGSPPGRLPLARAGGSRGTAGGGWEAGEEGRGEGGEEPGAGQRGSDRGAEVGPRVLDPADLAALLVGHRRDGHAAELGGQRADPQAREQQRPGHDLGPGADVKQRQQ